MPDYDSILRSIDGLEGRRPVGAVLRVGQKDARTGQIDPKANDAFQVVVPIQSPLKVGKRDVGYRAPHPEFAFFNRAPADRRRIFKGFLVHDAERDVWEFGLGAVDLGVKDPRTKERWPVHPNKVDACSSPDGIRATRLVALDRETGAEEWAELDCPNRQCEFRQPGRQVCKVKGRLYFMPRWADDQPQPDSGKAPPRPLMLWANKSWNSSAFVIGFFDEFDAMAKALGLAGLYRIEDGRKYALDEPTSLQLVPFTLSLSMKTDRRRGRVYPVVTMTPDGDLARFLDWRAGLVGPAVRFLPAAPADPDEAERAAEDFADIGPVRVPAVVEPETGGSGQPPGKLPPQAAGSPDPPAEGDESGPSRAQDAGATLPLFGDSVAGRTFAAALEAYRGHECPGADRDEPEPCFCRFAFTCGCGGPGEVLGADMERAAAEGGTCGRCE